MKIQDITEKKMNKKILSDCEINFVVNNYTSGKITDEEMTKWLKAICINSMTKKETYFLTKALQNSGKTLNLSSLQGVTADKHSSGGVSDTTTLIIAPIVASCGVFMLKSSGRGLGFTGGTADKLECFAGYKTEIPIESAIQLTKKNGACLISQSNEFAPADKKIYALRDITGTVESLPLIISSIVSKKLASGNNIFVLDVKYGSGAFMKSLKEAILLAKGMVNILKNDGKKAVAVITNMNQPLGFNVGDKMEVCEALDVLAGKENNLATVSKFLSAKIVELALNINFKKAKSMVEEKISTGEALQKLQNMVKDSGGSLELFKHQNLPKPNVIIKSDKTGYVQSYNTKNIGLLAVELGCGRINKEDKVNHNVGIKTHFKIGDKVEKNDVIFEIVSEKSLRKDFESDLINTIEIIDTKVAPQKLIEKIIN